MNRAELEALVRAVVTQTLTLPTLGTPTPPPPCADDVCTPRDHQPQRPADPVEAKRVQDASPARLVQGRTGTRYLTASYLQLRSEHAIALDAVHSSVPEGWAEQHGCLPLRSRCQDHAQFLLYPDLGRRLDDPSKAKLAAEGSKGADVQVIAGDGLSAHALLTQGPALLPALEQALRAQGFSLGKPVFVRFARIGVADEIGALLGAKSTVILVGERPGLGTGDSLSLYTAFRPRLQQDNAEKNCISNVRQLGHPTGVAALDCAKLMRRTFDAGGGGIHLVRPTVGKRAEG